MPLPPIISKNSKVSIVPKGHIKNNTLKNEFSHQSLGGKLLKGKKFNEDLIKVDKAKIYKKTFAETNKFKKSKKA